MATNVERAGFDSMGPPSPMTTLHPQLVAVAALALATSLPFGTQVAYGQDCTDVQEVLDDAALAVTQADIDDVLEVEVLDSGTNDGAAVTEGAVSTTVNLIDTDDSPLEVESAPSTPQAEPLPNDNVRIEEADTNWDEMKSKVTSSFVAEEEETGYDTIEESGEPDAANSFETLDLEVRAEVPAADVFASGNTSDSTESENGTSDNIEPEDAAGVLVASDTTRDEIEPTHAEASLSGNDPQPDAATVESHQAVEVSAALETPEQEGWVIENGTKRYYRDGSAVTGRQKIADKWYYFESNTASLIASKFVRDASDGATLYYDASGIAQFGENNIYGFLYYFDPKSGARTESSFVYQANEKKTTYHDDLGHALFGEQQINGSTYYFKPTTAARTESEFVTLSNPSKTIYLDENGKMVRGQKTINSVKHYFDAATGALYKKGYQNPSGYFQVGALNVTLPYANASWPFNYATASRISVDATRSDCIEAMIATAYDYLGTTYVWDYSCAPGVGVDCAGLVMQCLYSTGINLGADYNPYDHFYTPGNDHYANDMSGDSRFQWVSLGNRTRGDLIFWPGHIAIYLGNDRIIEAYPGYVMTNSIWAHGTPSVVRRVYL